MASEPTLVEELWESLIAAAVGLWWLLRRPWLLSAVAVAIWVVVTGGWVAGALVLGVIALIVVGLRILWPHWFHRMVSAPLRKAQTGGRYRRRRGQVMELCSLAKDLDGQKFWPELLRVQVRSVSDRLLVGMVTGQSITDYERACPELAASLRRRNARDGRQIGSNPGESTGHRLHHCGRAPGTDPGPRQLRHR